MEVSCGGVEQTRGNANQGGVEVKQRRTGEHKAPQAPARKPKTRTHQTKASNAVAHLGREAKTRGTYIVVGRRPVDGAQGHAPDGDRRHECRDGIYEPQLRTRQHADEFRQSRRVGSGSYRQEAGHARGRPRKRQATQGAAHVAVQVRGRTSSG